MKILTVSQLTASIKKNLESTFTFLAVQGEVGNLTKQASGHIYFTLKDKEAQIASVLFKGNAAALSRVPKEGDQIVAKGELSVYAPRGSYQLIVREIEFAGVGVLLKKLHDLKLKLEKMGWFEPSLKKTLPKIPKTIGVITSPTGSVIQDIIHVLSRRFKGFHLILNPVRVQGEGAAQEIAGAINDFNTHELADVLIVCRGGGSLEDLWPFNEEEVAAAIYNSKIPVISAVGHETDFSISDFVADVRAPTPSAAAELVIVEKVQQMLNLSKARTRMIQSIQSHLRSHRRLLEALTKQSVFSSPYMLLSTFIQKIDEMKEDIEEAALGCIEQKRNQLNHLIKLKETLNPRQQLVLIRKNFSKISISLLLSFQRKIRQKKERLGNLSNHLQAIDPRNLLKKGYSIVFHEKKDSVILSKNEPTINERLRIKLSDGELIVTVEEKS